MYQLCYNTCYELGFIISRTIHSYAGAISTCFYGQSDRKRHERKGVLPVTYTYKHGFLPFNIFRDWADTIQDTGVLISHHFQKGC